MKANTCTKCGRFPASYLYESTEIYQCPSLCSSLEFKRDMSNSSEEYVNAIHTRLTIAWNILNPKKGDNFGK